jgi:hypothetical protein
VCVRRERMRACACVSLRDRVCERVCVRARACGHHTGSISMCVDGGERAEGEGAVVAWDGGQWQASALMCTTGAIALDKDLCVNTATPAEPETSLAVRVLLLGSLASDRGFTSCL